MLIKIKIAKKYVNYIKKICKLFLENTKKIPKKYFFYAILLSSGGVYDEISKINMV